MPLVNNRYEISEAIGAGSEGTVYRCVDRATGREVALKAATSDGDSHRLARLRGEYARLARTRHPNLLAVHEIDRVQDAVGDLAAGAMFFTADLVSGTNLASWASGRSGLDVLARLEDVASALVAVHGEGLIHCDVKPANIVVGDEGAVLLDFGLSVEGGVPGTARGTLAYMDRRAMAGAPDAQSDLHALGVAFYRALTGAPPFPHTDPRTLLAALEAGRPLPIVQACPDLEEPIAAVIDALIVDDTRPASAQRLLDRLWSARVAIGATELDRRTPTTRVSGLRLVGREHLVASLLAGVRTNRDDDRAPLLRLVGPSGHGGKAVLAELGRRAQIAHIGARAPLELLAGDASRLLDELAPTAELPPLTGRALVVASANRASQTLAARAADRPVLLILDQPSSDPRAVELISALAAGDDTLDRVAVTVLARATPNDVESADRGRKIALDPLTEDDTTALVDAALPVAPPQAWIARLHEAALGRPGAILAALRRAGGPGPLAAPDSLLSGEYRADLRAALVRDLEELEPAERTVLVAAAIASSVGGVAALAGEGESSETESQFRSLLHLESLGWLSVEGDRVRMRTELHRETAEASLSATRRRELHRLALEHAQDAGSLTPAAAAQHLAVTGPTKRAVAAFRDAAQEAFRTGDLEAAARLAREALERSEGSIASALSLLLAEIGVELGEYDEAAAAAERAARSRDAERKRRAQLVLGRVRARAGDLPGAQRALEALLEAAPNDRSASGALARVLIRRGRFDEAAKRAGDIDELVRADDEGVELCLEAAGLAALYRGDRDPAVRCFGRLEALAASRGDEALAGRAASLLGLAAHHAGDISRAAEYHGRAAALAARTGQIHSAATCDINRAAAEADRGRFVSALSALDRALVALRRLGNVTEVPAALYNRAHALFALGDMAAARETAERSLERAASAGTPQFELYSHLLIGDTHRRRGEYEAAEESYARAREVAERAGAAVDAVAVDLNLAELRAETGDARAFDHLRAAESAADDGQNRDRALLTAARVCLRLGRQRDELVDDLEEAAARAKAGGRDDLHWRLGALAARLLAAAGDRPRASALARGAAAEFERAILAAPTSRRAAMREDPDAAGLAGLEAELELSQWREGLAPPTAENESTLRRLLSLSRRLNSELRVEPLLDQVIDTAIELTGAERGFLLLRQRGSRALEVAVARNIDREGLSESELALSRSIAERAARSGELVLAVDAAFDERFDTAESVAAMRLRSVLAVPLRHRGELIGTIYVDHRFQIGAFDEGAVKLCNELANIAAVAIGNARVVEENRRRQREIDALNGKLEEELSDRENELAHAKLKLPPGHAHGLATPEIVGSSPAIATLLELVERLAHADLPVVIGGESGSGKELVARALHRLSPRRHGPFVAVNCGAVPEALLESELFGHVRGSFTGADRNRRGHFEIADGGTLFLDEIADTSAAMQTKLLRVIQEGELRRLGDEDVRRVDVRIVAATNRDLRELVDAGRFREDLYFRLQVLAVTVPPLRDRASDIPELAAHILGKLASRGSVRRLSAAATASLCRYHWPGNVRELENELARAAALSTETIDRDHLSEAIRAAPASAPTPNGENLHIKQHVEALERELIAAALERSGGNQTRAAKLLGLSRYGLQKKLKRYELGQSSP